MTKLTDEMLERIRTSHRGAVYGNVEAGIAPTQAERDRGALLDHIDALTTELEDTRAAAQLAQRQLDACRRGQGTYEGTTR